MRGKKIPSRMTFALTCNAVVATRHFVSHLRRLAPSATFPYSHLNPSGNTHWQIHRMRNTPKADSESWLPSSPLFKVRDVREDVIPVYAAQASSLSGESERRTRRVRGQAAGRVWQTIPKCG